MFFDRVAAWGFFARSNISNKKKNCSDIFRKIFVWTFQVDLKILTAEWNCDFEEYFDEKGKFILIERERIIDFERKEK